MQRKKLCDVRTFRLKCKMILTASGNWLSPCEQCGVVLNSPPSLLLYDDYYNYCCCCCCWHCCWCLLFTRCASDRDSPIHTAESKQNATHAKRHEIKNQREEEENEIKTPIRYSTNTWQRVKRATFIGRQSLSRARTHTHNRRFGNFSRARHLHIVHSIARCDTHM